MKNRVFFPQSLLDLLVDADEIELDGEQLVLRDGGYRYRIAEAVRIIEQLEGSDPHQLLGKVKTRHRLRSLGAEIFSDSMLVGDAAYTVQPGFTGVPVEPPNRESGHDQQRELQVLASLSEKASP